VWYTCGRVGDEGWRWRDRWQRRVASGPVVEGADDLQPTTTFGQVSEHNATEIVRRSIHGSIQARRVQSWHVKIVMPCRLHMLTFI
jgi:hypothetical protein